MVTGKRSVTFPAVLFLISLSAALLAEAATAPGDIYGTYRSASTGGASIRDVVQITRRENRKIGIDLTLHFGAGQTCHLRNDGAWQNDHLVVTAEGLDENRPCRLEAFFTEGQVKLKDDGQRCAQVYCGSRGKIDGVMLPKVRTR